MKERKGRPKGTEGQRRYQRIKKSGMCARYGCKEKAYNGLTVCLNHAEQKAAASAVVRMERVERHECVRCGVKLHPAHKLKSCVECHTNELKRCKEQYNKFKAEGRCVICGKPAKRVGDRVMTRCEHHSKPRDRDRENEALRRRRAEKKWLESVGMSK